MWWRQFSSNCPHGRPRVCAYNLSPACRLWLLEMRRDNNIYDWQENYRNETLEEAVIPHSFGSLPWGE